MTEAPVFDSLFNFRDVGGCATVSGGVVRPGLVFRSDSLARVGEADLARLAGLGIRAIIDLRRHDEVASAGRVPDTSGWAYHHLPPEHPLWEEATFDEESGPARFLADRYLELAHHGAAGLGTVLRLLATPGTMPAVVHCFAGKDRTGVVIALTLALLGVDDEAIAADYARTQEWTNGYAPLDLPPHWILAPAEAMMIFLADMRAEYGSIEAYAVGAGLTAEEIAALRALLVETGVGRGESMAHEPGVVPGR